MEMLGDNGLGSVFMVDLSVSLDQRCPCSGTLSSRSSRHSSRHSSQYSSRHSSQYSSQYSSRTYSSRTKTLHGVTALNGWVNRHDNSPSSGPPLEQTQ